MTKCTVCVLLLGGLCVTLLSPFEIRYMDLGVKGQRSSGKVHHLILAGENRSLPGKSDLMSEIMEGVYQINPKGRNPTYEVCLGSKRLYCWMCLFFTISSIPSYRTIAAMRCFVSDFYSFCCFHFSLQQGVVSLCHAQHLEEMLM